MTARAARVLFALLVLSRACGCTYTVAGDTPAAIEVEPPSFRPRVEYTVAEFSFVLGGGDPAPSLHDGRLLGSEIMESWAARGYVAEQRYVADGQFSGDADYHLTLHGSQRGDTSFTMQVINALTLSLIPYTITQEYDFEYVLDAVRSGKQYTATVQAADKTWVDGLLVLALPFAGRGHRTTMQRAGDVLYDHFRRQGAFSAPAAAQSSPGRAPATLDEE